MAYNRELSQLASFVEVNDTSKRIGFSTDLNIAGVVTATRFYGSGRFLTDVIAESVSTASADDKQILFSNNSTISGATQFYYDNTTNNVGIGTSIPTSKLQVSGNVLISGIATIATGVITNLSGTNLNYTGISTLTNLSGTNLNYTGISTIGTVKISSGIITATSGIVTYYGDGSKLTNILSGVGVATAGGTVGTGATILDFRGAGISTVTVASGIATINITGGGSGSVGIGSSFPASSTNGNLFYHIDYGRTFVYYDEVALGIGATAVWIDAAPFNQGGLFVSKYGDNMFAGLGVTVGSLSSPSVYFNGYTNSGFYSPAANEFGVVVSGTQRLNVNSSGIIVTGVATATDFDSLSDINYKQNVSTVNNALSTVEQLRGVKFDWKESGLPSYGVIAQELEVVLPELVHGEDPKTVNYNGIIGVLIEAIKELKAEIEELKNSK